MLRGPDVQQSGLFSRESVECRIPANRPLRAVRALLDEALAATGQGLSPACAGGGSCPVSPAQLERALMLRVPHPICTERLFTAPLDHNPLFR